MIAESFPRTAKIRVLSVEPVNARPMAPDLMPHP